MSSGSGRKNLPTNGSKDKVASAVPGKKIIPPLSVDTAAETNSTDSRDASRPSPSFRHHTGVPRGSEVPLSSTSSSSKNIRSQIPSSRSGSGGSRVTPPATATSRSGGNTNPFHTPTPRTSSKLKENAPQSLHIQRTPPVKNTDVTKIVNNRTTINARKSVTPVTANTPRSPRSSKKSPPVPQTMSIKRTPPPPTSSISKTPTSRLQATTSNEKSPAIVRGSPKTATASASKSPRSKTNTSTSPSVPGQKQQQRPSEPKPRDPLIIVETPQPSCCFCGDACTCGDDCQCSEELCQCQAYQLMHSMNTNTKPLSSPCCGKGNSSSPKKGKNVHFVHKESIPENDQILQNIENDLYEVAEFSINGMTCSMCSQAISRAVQDLVENIQISLATDLAKIVWKKSHADSQKIKEAIESIGYDVQDVRMINTKESMSQNGITQEDQQETMEERWQRYRQRQQNKVVSRRRAFLSSLIGMLPILFITMILPFFHRHFFGNMDEFLKHKQIRLFGHTFYLEAIILWLLATPVQFFCGWEFYKGAWFGFITGKAGMDVLVALGTTASYGYAVLGAWNGDHHSVHFFETSAVLISFILAGKWMQAAAVRRTSEALTQLMSLQSPTALKISHESSDAFHFNPLVDSYVEELVDIHSVVIGDIVKIIRGASIPADGRVMYGDILVDESMITGESVPVLKTAGSVVLGGTVCMESGISVDDLPVEESERPQNLGAAFVQVTGVGSSTALAQIVQLVQEAQTRAVPIQSFADTVSSFFVPAVCTVALLTFMIWYALCSSNVVPSEWYSDLHEEPMTFSLMFAIACLVISCPCALGLATPTALMVGTGVGAKCGVLMKGGESLEIASKVDSVVFDKTGTLTKGSPVVSDFIQLTNKGETSEDEHDAMQDYLLWLLGSLERMSEHPLARAIVQYAEENLGEALTDNPFVTPTNFRGLTGRGASGLVLGKVKVAVGNRLFASLLNLSVPIDADEHMKCLEDHGKTAILAAIDGTVVAVLGIADEIKEDAAVSVRYLRDVMNIDVWIVTGDNMRTAAAVSRRLGISPERVIAEALPAGKLEKVRELQEQNHIVAMVGDGVNDSPALAQADVGISMGTGASIANEASDMVLVKGNVADVCTALHLSRAIFRRIKWNLLCSLIYNILGIPVAAGVLFPILRARLPPTVAAVAMALSSVSVVLSSLTLRLYHAPKVTINSRPIRSSTTWARTMERIEVRDAMDEMRVRLLASDHLASSEITQRVDNRTINHLEEGL